jgi:hypothetical protein
MKRGTAGELISCTSDLLSAVGMAEEEAPLVDIKLKKKEEAEEGISNTTPLLV